MTPGRRARGARRVTDEWLARWGEGDCFPTIRRAWLDRAGPTGRPLRVRINGEETEGVYGGLDADGALRLLMRGRRRAPHHRRRRLFLEPVRRRSRDMSRKSDGKADFVFLPLGGVGEIGMNLYLYGYGRGRTTANGSSSTWAINGFAGSPHGRERVAVREVCRHARSLRAPAHVERFARGPANGNARDDRVVAVEHLAAAEHEHDVLHAGRDHRAMILSRIFPGWARRRAAMSAT